MASRPARNPSLILASTSPRRIELLKQVGFVFSVKPPRTQENARRGERPRELVARLAKEKARAVLMSGAPKPNTVIIAADTIVVDPNGQKILGKPRDPADARRMLGRLAGKTHTVLTGYCVLYVPKAGIDPSPSAPTQIVRVISSKVRMRPLDRTTIASYVTTGEPMDKAGAYAAQGIGMAFIESIRGSYTNVVGLPMAQLLGDLERHFGILILARSR